MPDKSSLPWFYLDRMSAEPGELVALHGSVPDDPCTLTITRVGAERTVVLMKAELVIGSHATPPDADERGCDWPVALTFEIGADWEPGYYDVALEGPDGERTRSFVCVKRADDRPRANAVIVLSTNTYQAYNHWGGRNSYADVSGMMSGQLSAEEAREGGIARLSRTRPYTQTLLDPPEGVPRLINQEVRAVGAPGIPGDFAWMMQHGASPYDGSAGFLRKWEHVFAGWCEKEGIALDYLTDSDLDGDDDPLEGYPCVLIVGHSEYWTGAMRDGLQSYVQGGGHLAIFSGNTGYWKVRNEDDGRSLIAYKWRGEEDPLWSDAATRGDATHVTSHPAFARPEAAVTGLSFLYGGYHRVGMCAARGTAGYTVWRDEHWSLEGADLYYGDQFGGDVPLVGYECDGAPLTIGEDGLPAPAPGGLGIPENLEIIASVSATLAESPRSPFPAIVPPEKPEVLAEIAYGSSDEDAVARLMRGHAVMASFRLGDGEVFNSGTTEWAHGLGADDPFVTAITKNVLKRFGAMDAE